MFYEKIKDLVVSAYNNIRMEYMYRRNLSRIKDDDPYIYK